MRWSIVGVIWLRELRDQLRDRRTLFMIGVLPLLLYPAAGFGVVQLALNYLGKPIVVGVQGHEALPSLTPRCSVCSPLPTLAWFSAVPGVLGVPLCGVERWGAAAILSQARRIDPQQDYPPLFLRENGNLRFVPLYLHSPQEAAHFVIKVLDQAALNADRGALDDHDVDVLLTVPANFTELLRHGERAPLHLLTRDGDERTQLAVNRLTLILGRWQKQLKDVRLRRRGLPADYDEPIEVRDAERAVAADKRSADNLFDLLVRVFPFVLVLWSLAGALYPAVDLCAGEKERGTMETLLISPASRAEIVYGKFLTIWVFSAATALFNLLSMGLTTWHFGNVLTMQASFRPAALFWAVVLLVPLSAFFSALCLVIGAYARSSKEGQYYLMPLFLCILPLIFLTLAPGVELNHFYSMVPVTGVALLLQKLMAVTPPPRGLAGYFVLVLAPMVVYGWLALRWAIEQFQREEVLFRESERLDIKLWLRHLFRDKEALPSAGQALFCFAVIFGLNWLALGVHDRFAPLSYQTVRYLACVTTPPLFMAVLLTTRPGTGLALRWPPRWAWPTAAALAVLLLPPFAALTLFLLQPYPQIRQTIEQARDLSASATGHAPVGLGLFVFAVLPALCEELAFRGFILSGLSNRFRPWTAVLLSSFLYAVYQMNVVQAAPHFFIGVVLALLVLRGGSLGAAIVFRLVWELLLWGPLLLGEGFAMLEWINPVVVVSCVVLAAPLLALLRPRAAKPCLSELQGLS